MENPNQPAGGAGGATGGQQARDAEVARANAGLLSALGPVSTILFVVGAVIGSGVFKKPGVMAGYLGSPGLLLLVWLLAGLIVLIGALVNSEIAAMIPEAGGQYVFFDRMYGSFAAYLYGWAMFAVVKTGAIASLMFVFSEAAGQLIKLPELSPALAAFSVHLPFIGDIAPLANIGQKALAASTILFLTVVNHFGVRFGSGVQNIFTLGKVAVLAALVGMAFLLPNGGSASHWTANSSTIHLEGLALFAAMAAALQGAFWAYDGWNDVTYIAGEVKNPQRNLPLGLIGGMLIVMAIYLTMNAAYSYVLPIDQMMQSKLVAADLANRSWSGSGRWIALGIMISTFGAANSNILSASRIYFAMARRNVFPGFLGVAHPRHKTPANSIWLQSFWSILLLFSGTFDTITDMLVFIAWIFYAAGAFGVIVLRKKEPDTPRPYRVPGYPWLPMIFVLFGLVFLVLTIYQDVQHYRDATAAGKPAIMNFALGLFLVFVGTPIYFLCRKREPAVVG